MHIPVGVDKVLITLSNCFQDALLLTSSHFCSILSQHHSGLVGYPDSIASNDPSDNFNFDPISFHRAVY